MRVPICLLAFAFALAPAQEAWVKAPRPSDWLLEPSMPTFLQADQDGRMAYRDRADYYNTELYEWRDGAYRVLEHPEPEALARYPFYGPDGALWITINQYISPGVNLSTLYRREHGAWSSLDNSHTCIAGDLPVMVGVDAQANAIIDGRPMGGYGKSSTGVYRLSKTGCSEIGLGIKGAPYGIGAYHQDARGREYFGIEGADEDGMGCRGIIRLDPDGRVFIDSLSAGICPERFASRGDTLLFGGANGMATLVGNAITPIPSLSGAPPYGVQALLVDSRGDTWIGLGINRQGLFRIRGKDTLQVDGGTPFAGVSILGLSEDRDGNIWLRTYGGYWIGLRDAGKNPIALRSPSRGWKAGGSAKAAKAFDLKGRRLPRAPRSGQPKFR
jgi:hypothetical protein